MSAPDYSWDIGVLEKLSQGVQPDAVAPSGCFELRGWQLRGFRDRLRELAARTSKGEVSPNLAVQSPVTLWPGGVVYYVFDVSVNSSQQRIFLDAAADLSAFAAVSFVPRTVQANFMRVRNVPGLGGGQSAVGMVGPAQTFDIGEGSWNRGTLVHELGHTLGFVHEHQRPDRDSFVTIQTANISPGAESNFVILAATTTGAYDFLSVMHYRRNALSTGAGLDTIVPTAAYAAFIDSMGNQYSRPLSSLDRAGLAATYGAGAAVSTVVTNTNAGGVGSLTVAIYRAVDAPGSTVTFNIPTSDPGYDAPSGTWTIRPTDQLPKLGRLTTLDATTQPGGASIGPKIVLDGLLTTQSVDVYAHGLELAEGGCNVRGFAIRDFDGDAIRIQGAGATDNVVTRCRLGCNAAGNAPATTGLSGLSIYDGAQRNRIGGPAALDRNIISGSRDVGLRIVGAGVRDNLVQGNFIGLRPDGSTVLANANSGVQIDTGANANVLRGNVISGNNNYGVALLGAGVTANRLEQNFIGTNASGTAAVPNLWSGVGIFSGASSNVIGGSAAQRNIISGNVNSGVAISGAGVSGNLVSGNFIGTDITGTAAIPNNWSGLQFGGGASGNTVGGIASGQANFVSGNRNYGIALFDAGTNGNVVAGNFIGLDATGATAIGNEWSGVGIFSGASNNVIGGSPAARNFISGNSNYGVAIAGVGTNGNVVQSDSIGYDATGTVLRGNAWDGVSIYGGAMGNQIGGVTPGTANRIGGNAIHGIVMFDAATSGNSILGNSISNNADIGIELYGGANSSQSPPAVYAASMTTHLSVGYDVSGVANAAYLIEFFASTQVKFGIYGEGRTFVGTLTLTTDGAGVASGTATFTVGLSPGSFITATATSPAGNSSRFAFAASVAILDSDGDGLPDAWESAFGLNSNNPADAALDADSDGFSATAEYLAGTDPRSSTSRLAPPAPAVSGNDLLLSIAPAIGRPFALEKSTDLQTWRVWTDSLLGTGVTQIFTDTGARLEPRRFYRARVGF